MEWEKSDRALKKLKQMLWGYESLRTFRDMLKKAIEQVDKAQTRMTKLLEKVGVARPMIWCLVKSSHPIADLDAYNISHVVGSIDSSRRYEERGAADPGRIRKEV